MLVHVTLNQNGYNVSTQICNLPSSNHTLYGQTEPLLKVNIEHRQAVSHYIRTQLLCAYDQTRTWDHDSVNNEAWGHGIRVWNH